MHEVRMTQEEPTHAGAVEPHYIYIYIVLINI